MNNKNYMKPVLAELFCDGSRKDSAGTDFLKPYYLDALGLRESVVFVILI